MPRVMTTKNPATGHTRRALVRSLIWARVPFISHPPSGCHPTECRIGPADRPPRWWFLACVRELMRSLQKSELLPEVETVDDTWVFTSAAPTLIILIAVVLAVVLSHVL